PLAIVRAIHDSVQHGDRGDEAGWKDIDREVARAHSGVEALLLLARLESGAVQPRSDRVRIDLLVEAHLPENSSAELVAEPSIVMADAELLGVAVDNLLRNAERHGGGGAVLVQVKDGTMRVTTSGPAFPEEVLRADSGTKFVSSHAGTGFGLALTRTIAALHGGTLELRNPPGGGTECVLVIPLVSQS
ncbi:MAG: HAMP domain-containing sensor histidine kinase, partial [Planctomycetota bacterium]